MKKYLTIYLLLLTFMSYANEDSLGLRRVFSQVPAKDDSGRKLMQDAIFEIYHRYTRNQQEYNIIFWGARIKGGGGFIQNQQGTTRYGGLFYHPKLSFGEITLATHFVSNGINTEYEIKGEYRFLNGWTFGGGYVNDGYENKNIFFEKIAWHKNLENWNFIISSQFMQVNQKNYIGGYASVFDANYMAAVGYDGEEFRATIGYIAPIRRRSMFRPAAEVFWVDRSIGGEIGGNNQLLIAATLGYRGGILSHPARLGRAMGPSGLEYSNPITFKTPSWNRLLNTWEQGSLLNFRVMYVGISEKNYSLKTEISVFPFQFFDAPRLLKVSFLGAYQNIISDNKSYAVVSGLSYHFKYFDVMGACDYNFQQKQIGIILMANHHF